MRPLLFELVLGPGTSIAFLIGGILLAVALAWRARDRAAESGLVLKRALVAAIQAAFTLGVMDRARSGLIVEKGRKPPDLLVPGAIGSLGAIGIGALVVRGGQPLAIPLLAYPVMLMLGFAFGTLVTIKNGARRGIESVILIDTAIVTLVAGVIGARAFFVAQFWSDHFDDRPAAIALSPPDPPLAKGDELVLAVGRDQVRVAFTGGEASVAEVARRMEGALAGRGVVKPLVLVRKLADGSIDRHERGLRLETTERGDSARLGVVGGAACAKLGLAPGMADAGAHVPWTRALAVWNGGLVFYGGLILAALLGMAHVHLRGVSMLSATDCVGPPLALGLAFGRVGCTLNGCCWGREAVAGEPSIVFPVGSHPWIQHAKAVLPPAFDRSIDAAATVEGPLRAALERAAPELLHGSRALLPIQPLAVGLDLLLFGALIIYDRKLAKRPGDTFFAFLVGYGLVRFVIEHLRGDHEDYATVLGYSLTVSQRVAVATAAVGLVSLVVRRIHRTGEGLRDSREKTQNVA